MVGMSWMREILQACRSTFDGLSYSNCQRGIILGNFIISNGWYELDVRDSTGLSMDCHIRILKEE